MINLRAAGLQIADFMDNSPYGPGMISYRLSQHLPTARLYSRDDMADSYNENIHQVVDEFSERFEQSLLRLSPRSTTRISPRVILIPMMAAFIAALGCTLGASFGIGCNALMEAARLYKSGQPEAAIARLRQNPIEVFYTLRAIENVFLFSLSGAILRTIYLLKGFPFQS